VLHLPLGLPGFAGARDFVLLDHRPGSVFRWLQSLDLPDLAFVVIDPCEFFADFPLPLVRRGLAQAGVDGDEDIAVLSICTIPPAPEEPTTNLLAPIAIGVTSRRGAQIVLHDSGFQPREPFLARGAGR
jgi:flagellar assembly factor FliW